MYPSIQRQTCLHRNSDSVFLVDLKTDGDWLAVSHFFSINILNFYIFISFALEEYIGAGDRLVVS